MKKTLLLIPISLSAFVATWGGWAKLSTMTGYEKVEMVPGQSWSTFNIGIVLPMGIEAYGALAMAVAFDVTVRVWARWIAGVSAVVTLTLAGIAQATVHNLTVQNKTVAPDYVVSFVSVLPVIVLGLGGALAMLAKAKIDPASQPASRGSSQVGGMLGRLAQAATNNMVSRLESRPGMDERDGMARDIPVSPAPAGTDIPAGQNRLVIPSKQALERDPEIIMMVAGWLKETPCPTVDQIASRLEASRTVAGRVRKEAAKMIEVAR